MRKSEVEKLQKIEMLLNFELELIGKEYGKQSESYSRMLSKWCISYDILNMFNIESLPIHWNNEIIEKLKSDCNNDNDLMIEKIIDMVNDMCYNRG